MVSNAGPDDPTPDHDEVGLFREIAGSKEFDYNSLAIAVVAKFCYVPCRSLLT